MPRIAGVDIPDRKRLEVALTYIMGIGRSNAQKILAQAKISPDKRSNSLTSEEVVRLQKVIDSYPTEGEVRKRIRENIQRLRKIGSYRGLRHSQNLPVRGQRTKTNARTKRGKKRTIGAMRKKDLAKMKNRTDKKDEKKS